MTAIAVATPRVFQERGYSTYPVNAKSHIYEGAMVCVQLSDGMLVDGADSAGLVFAGFSMTQVDGGTADGDVTADVWQRGVVTVAAASAAASDVGQVVYLKDNNTVQLAATTHCIPVGRVVKFNSSSSLDIDITDYAGLNKGAGLPIIGGVARKVVTGRAAFATTGQLKTVSAGGLTSIISAFATYDDTAGPAASEAPLYFKTTAGAVDITAGNVTVNRPAGTSSGAAFYYILIGS